MEASPGPIKGSESRRFRSSSIPGPLLWLHSCHGLDASQLQSLPVNRRAGSVAEAFAQEADRSDRMLGVQCHLDDATLYVEMRNHELVPVASLFLAELSYCALASDWADMAVMAIVPTGSGGISEAAVAKTGQGWFVILQGLRVAMDLMDLLSVRGCLRNDLGQSFAMAHEGDCTIGEGAYATVYHMQARDGRAVAVKQMNYTTDYESIAREVSALVEVQGDHIIGFRGIFWSMEQEHIRFTAIFDLAPCGDLLFKILKNGAMTEATARPLFSGILRGLKRIHDHDLVHRDIKTENILLQKGNIPMVADFGLACKVWDEQQMARRCGSAGFVAPEVCLGTPYDSKVDNFGAGVILFFLLSKEMPFSSPDRDSAATMRKTVKCSLHLQRPPFNEMTSRLRNMLRQLICKNQEDRLTAAAALEHSWMTGKSDKTSGSSSKKKEQVLMELPKPEAKRYTGEAVTLPPPLPATPAIV
ncbi:unnamed protein product [Effrenium voratum]|nr:unnamed protein product [Effrenium voratum]